METQIQKLPEKTLKKLEVIDRPVVYINPELKELSDELSKYSFENENLRVKTGRSMEHYLRSKQLGLNKQAELSFQEMRKNLYLDMSNKVVSVAKKSGFKKAKIYAYYDLDNSDDPDFENPFVIKLFLSDWLVFNVKNWDKKIPVSCLQALDILQKSGFKISHCGVAIPMNENSVSKLLVNSAKEAIQELNEILMKIELGTIIDPIFLVKLENSPFWVQIERWR